jgi:hypothetical protein
MTTTPAPVPRRAAPRRLSRTLLATLVVFLATGVVLFARHDGRDNMSSSDAIEGSGAAATQTRSVPAFTRFDLAGASAVTVHVGGKQAVVVRADDNLIDLVTTEVRDSELVIGTNGSFTAKTPMTVDVTVPTLDAATLSGSGLVVVDGLRAAQFTVDVAGSGVLTVTGIVERLDADLGGSGDVRLEGLAAQDVTATVSGSGRLQVNATGDLDASVSGSGAIFYSGNPSNVTTSITGTGAVIEL